MDGKKFCEYVDKYRVDLYIMALSILKNEADAEDAVSNAILKAYENRNQIRAFQKFKPWILTITKNEALKIKRKRLLLPGDETVEAMLKPVYAQYDELWDALQQVKEEYREVLVLFYYEGFSLRDIAKFVGIPVGTVKSRLSRGRQELKNALERGQENGSL